MSNESEKEYKVQIPESLLSFTQFPDLSAIQKSLKPIFEQRETFLNLAKSMKPIADMAVQLQKRYKQHNSLTREMVIPYHRPVEYKILDELRSINENQQEITKNQQAILDLREDGVDCIIYDVGDGSLSHVLGGSNFSYDMTSDGKRKQMFEILFRTRKYVNTNDLKESLGCPSTQAVAKIVQTFNAYASDMLRLNGEKLIQGRKGSGYRINPKIRVESSRNY